MEATESMTGCEKSVISNIWTRINLEDQVKMLFLFYNDLDLNQQSDLFSFLGDSLNENIFKVTTDNFKNAKDLDIEELKTC